MNSMRPVQSTGSGAAVRTALAPATETRVEITPARSSAPSASVSVESSSGYGLPCAKCRKYYSASLPECPVCRSAERVSPAAAIPGATSAATPAQNGARDDERERFLREFKSKLYETHTQINPETHQECAFAKKGKATHQQATVCKGCYDRLQARLDLFEAALHMDLKEASQVIYEAVWADTTDSTKTYRNAAQALLSELRKRAGMKLVLSKMQPLAH